MIGGASNFSFSRPTGRSGAASSVSRVVKRLLSAGWKVAVLLALIRYVRQRTHL